MRAPIETAYPNGRHPHRRHRGTACESLNKLEDTTTGELWYTNVACDLLDLENCRCGDCPNRSTLVPDCVILTPANSKELYWMPNTCAYRLPDWHPLIVGDPQAMLRFNHTIRSRVVHEKNADDLENHLITWFS